MQTLEDIMKEIVTKKEEQKVLHDEMESIIEIKTKNKKEIQANKKKIESLDTEFKRVSEEISGLKKQLDVEIFKVG